MLPVTKNKPLDTATDISDGWYRYPCKPSSLMKIAARNLFL